MDAFDLIGAEPPTRGVLIKVKNVGQLAATQGGAPGALAAALVPETIEGVVLDKMVQQFRSNLKDKGVDADVQVVSTTMPPARSGLREGVVLGVVGAGVGAGLGWVAWRHGLRRLVSRFL